MAGSVIIVGGGAAGLAAGAVLASRGIGIQIFESRPFLGGRLYSFTDPVTKDSVDNGQHLMAGFYFDTFKLLSIIGSSDHLARQTHLTIDFLDRSRKYSHFACSRLPAPLNFLSGFLSYSRFPKGDLFRLLLKGWKIRHEVSSSANAYDILKMLGQSEDGIESFFKPLVLATLNSDLKSISGNLFVSMLRSMMASRGSDNVLVYSTIGLSDLLASPAASYINDLGGRIHLSTPITKVLIESGRVVAVLDSTGKRHSADSYIIALPPDGLSKIVPGVTGLIDWQYSPIVSVNLWYDKPVVDKLMAGFVGSRFHWCFDKASIMKSRKGHPYVTLLISAAHSEMSLTRRELIDIAISEMRTYYEAATSARVIHSQVIKEKKATVNIAPEMAGRRSECETAWGNCFLAGDWVNTGLPATIESAVRSGFQAAEMAVKNSR